MPAGGSVRTRHFPGRKGGYTTLIDRLKQGVGRAAPLHGLGAVIEGDGVLGFGEEEPALDHQARQRDHGGEHGAYGGERIGKGNGQGG